MFADLLAAQLFPLVIVFARLGAALIALPGFGEQSVPARVRLLIALGLAVAAAPAVGDAIPPPPAAFGDLARLLLSEVAIGLFIGGGLRLISAGLEAAGAMISYQTGLSSALVFNPGLSEQGTLPGLFLSLLGSVLIFQTGLDHLMIRGAVDSYALFRPGAPPPIGDFAEAATRLAARSFRLAIALAGPFLIAPTLLFVGLGLIARLMPQLPIFFVALPAQLALGLVLFAVCLSAMMLAFLDGMSGALAGLLDPGR